MSEFIHYLTFPYLWQGVWFTLALTVMGFGGGAVLGLVLTFMQSTRFRALTALARMYTTLYRGTPLVLQLVFVFTVLPRVGITFSPIVAGGVALALNEGAFFSEIFRSAIKAIEPGQIAAGRALGMTPVAIARRVIRPQALRAIVPALGSESIAVMKNSALASVIAVPELTLRTQQLASATFDYFGIYFATAVMYLILTGILTAIQVTTEWSLDLDRGSRSPLVSKLLSRFKETGSTDPMLVAALSARDPGDNAPADATDISDGSSHRLTQVDPPPRWFGELAIEGYGIHKAYGPNEVLKGIDLKMKQGEVIALLGPSGSGKSTLLRTINHLESTNQGSILVNGVPIGFDENGNELRERLVAKQRVDAGVGMVFQQFNLFSHLTARENVAAPLRWVHGWSKEEADARADEMLAQVGLTERASALPRHLSGGQQQRVGIARAIAPHPRVLLLDEPTSALDPELVAEVLQVIRRLADGKGLTMIIATHQLNFAREVADRVIFMAEGHIVEEGPPDQVILNPQNPITRRFVGVIDAAEV
jgi:polar amino acid transport system permease protein